MFDRTFNGSLYSCGYADGYENKDYSPHWKPELQTDVILYVLSEKEIAEYEEGFKDGKLHLAIDKKR